MFTKAKKEDRKTEVLAAIWFHIVFFVVRLHMMHIITSGFVEKKNMIVKQRRMMLMKSQHKNMFVSSERKIKVKIIGLIR